MAKVQPKILRTSAFNQIHGAQITQRAGYPLRGRESVFAAGRVLSLGLHQHPEPIEAFKMRGMQTKVSRSINKRGVIFELKPKIIGAQKPAQKGLVASVYRLLDQSELSVKCPYWALKDSTWFSVRISRPFEEEDLFLFDPVFPFGISHEESEQYSRFYDFLDHLLSIRCFRNPGSSAKDDLRIEVLENDERISPIMNEMQPSDVAQGVGEGVGVEVGTGVGVGAGPSI